LPVSGGLNCAAPQPWPAGDSACNFDDGEVSQPEGKGAQSILARQFDPAACLEDSDLVR
jgi:hypothetical protein